MMRQQHSLQGIVDVGEGGVRGGALGRQAPRRTQKKSDGELGSKRAGNQDIRTPSTKQGPVTFYLELVRKQGSMLPGPRELVWVFLFDSLLVFLLVSGDIQLRNLPHRIEKQENGGNGDAERSTARSPPHVPCRSFVFATSSSLLSLLLFFLP